jgi:site-specific recombinase XerD
MKTHNPENERIKRAYFTYLAEAKGFSEPTLDGIAKALNRFETYTKFRDFKAFHVEQAKGFKASLAGQMSLRTKDRLSKATQGSRRSLRNRALYQLSLLATGPRCCARACPDHRCV